VSIRHSYATPQAVLEAQRKERAYITKHILPLAYYESAQRTMVKLARAGPVDRGHYRLGWEVRRKAPQSWRLRTRVGLAARVGNHIPEVQLVNTAPYSGIIEQGARPFWPPIAPLIAWAERKAGALSIAGILKINPGSFATRADGSLRYRGRASLDSPAKKAVKSFAYGVQRKIAREGLPAQWIMRRHLLYARKIIADSTRRQLILLSQRGPV
jgi:hypothetical protein